MRPVCRDPQAWRSRLVLFLMFAAVAQDTLRALNVAPDAPVGDIIAPLAVTDEGS